MMEPKCIPQNAIRELFQRTTATAPGSKRSVEGIEATMARKIEKREWGCWSVLISSVGDDVAAGILTPPIVILVAKIIIAEFLSTWTCVDFHIVVHIVLFFYLTISRSNPLFFSYFSTYPITFNTYESPSSM